MNQAPPVIRWGLIDRAVALISPRAASQRYAARIALGNLRRAYDGSAKGCGTDGWTTSGKAADAEIGLAAPLLRNRMRDLVRNNPLAAKAVAVLVNSLVGTGIRPRASGTDKALNKLVDDLWARSADQCDADGHTDFHGLLSLAMRETIEGGDVFARLCCTNPVRDSSCESSVVAGGHEQTEHTDLQDLELARLSSH